MDAALARLTVPLKRPGNFACEGQSSHDLSRVHPAIRRGAPLSGTRWSRVAPRSAAIGGALIVACGLTACTPDTPEFVPPIVWKAYESHRPGEGVPDHVVVELLDDRQARLTGFPIGRSMKPDQGTYCIDGFTDERYTGAATWEVRTRFSCWVEFDDSKVLVAADQQFCEEDWSTIGFHACEDERWWEISYVCGDSGYGSNDNATTFRGRCATWRFD